MRCSAIGSPVYQLVTRNQERWHELSKIHSETGSRYYQELLLNEFAVFNTKSFETAVRPVIDAAKRHNDWALLGLCCQCYALSIHPIPEQEDIDILKREALVNLVQARIPHSPLKYAEDIREFVERLLGSDVEEWSVQETPQTLTAFAATTLLEAGPIVRMSKLENYFGLARDCITELHPHHQIQLRHFGTRAKEWRSSFALFCDYWDDTLPDTFISPQTPRIRGGKRSNEAHNASSASGFLPTFSTQTPVALRSAQGRRPPSPISSTDSTDGSMLNRVETLSNAASLLKFSDMAYLDTRFTLRNSSFFQVGRVVRMLRREVLGSNKYDGNAKITGFDGGWISQVSWGAVVKTFPDASWVIPIRTYGGRGLTPFATMSPKIKLHAMESHAIIYSRGTEPRLEPDEPRPNKLAIEVLTSPKGVKLDPQCRIDFAKPFTVEHSRVPVDEVGIVTLSSMPHFMAHWRETVASTTLTRTQQE